MGSCWVLWDSTSVQSTDARSEGQTHKQTCGRMCATYFGENSWNLYESYPFQEKNPQFWEMPRGESHTRL